MGKYSSGKGDKGLTHFLGPNRIWKNSSQVEAYGTVDELNVAIGVARANINDPEIDATLKHIQEDLFIVGADLATPPGRSKMRGGKPLPSVDLEMVQSLDKQIEKNIEGLKPIDGFIIPGRSLSSALLHSARVVARRAERRAVALAKRQKVNDQVLAYLNRVSSLIFVLARLAALKQGLQEDVWRYKSHALT